MPPGVRARGAGTGGPRRPRVVERTVPPPLRGLPAGLAGGPCEVAAGAEALVGAAVRPADLVMASIVGAAGLRSAWAAAGTGTTLALANKESLVCAGDAFMRDAGRYGARILPVDSEHNALAQAMGDGRVADIATLTPPPHGGPFRPWTRERHSPARPAQGPPPPPTV